MASRQPPVARELHNSPENSQAFVRILGTRLGRFIEFEFSLGEGDLAVELILPPLAFKEFCRDRHARMLPPAKDVAAEVDRLAWRAGQPGLLRRPEH